MSLSMTSAPFTKTPGRMNSHERMQAALTGRSVDRPPVAFHNFLMTGRHAGFHDLGQWLQDGEMIAAAQLAVWRDIGHDALMIENGVTAMAQAVGCEIHYQKDVPPHVLRPLLADGLEDVEKLRVPDPERAHPLREVLKAVRICRQETGGQVYLQGRADQGPNALAMALRGPEQWVLDLMDPDSETLVERVLEFTTNCSLRYAQALIAAGAHGSCIGGAGLSMLSPGLFRRFELPCERRWCQGVQQAGGHAFVHICGDESPILRDMVSSGADSLELDPGTEAAAVKSEVLGTTAVLGMLRPTLFELGTTQQVREHVRQTLTAFAGCPRFIIGPGCALPVDTKIENLAVLMEEVSK